MSHTGPKLWCPWRARATSNYVPSTPCNPLAIARPLGWNSQPFFIRSISFKGGTHSENGGSIERWRRYISADASLGVYIISSLPKKTAFNLVPGRVRGLFCVLPGSLVHASNTITSIILLPTMCMALPIQYEKADTIRRVPPIASPHFSLPA